MTETKILTAPLEFEQEQEAPKKSQSKRKRMSEDEVAHQLRNDYRTVLSTRAGRNILRRLLNSSGLFADPANNSGSWTYYHSGRAAVGRKLAEEIKAADFSAFQLMEREAYEEGEPYDVSN